MRLQCLQDLTCSTMKMITHRVERSEIDITYNLFIMVCPGTWAQEMVEYVCRGVGDPCNLIILIWSSLHDRWGDPPNVTSPIFKTIFPRPCKQALRLYLKLNSYTRCMGKWPIRVQVFCYSEWWHSCTLKHTSYWV